VIEARTRMRAHTQWELAGQLREAGFTKIRWNSPAATGYFQPILSAIRK